MKVAFLDRDGTIISDYPDAAWANITEPEFLPGSILALKKLQTAGYQIIIVSNQYLINEGIITETQFQLVQNRLLDILKKQGIDILDCFYCPHTDSDDCQCKKPKPGMILAALKKYPEIDLKDSFLVGDSLVDIGLAAYFGLPAYGIGLSNDSCKYRGFAPVASLNEAVERIVKSQNE